MTPTARDLRDLPLLLPVWSPDEDAVTAGRLAGDLPRSTSYRLASNQWPTTRVGGRLRVQTVPFIREHFGVDLTQA